MLTICKKAHILIWGLLLCGETVFGQSALHLRNLPTEITAQAYQPAYLAMQDTFSIQLGGGIGYWAGSNVLSMDLLFLENQFLTDQNKDDIIGQLQTDNRLGLGFLWDATVNLQVKQQVFSLFTRAVTNTYAGFHDPRSLGLLLYGNARYAGETLTDEAINLGLTGYQEIGLGTAWKMGKWATGIRIKALLGTQATLMQNLDYSLFTEDFGAKLQMESEYEFFRAQSEGTAGLGAGLDLGLVYELKPDLTLQAAVQDLGFLRWTGESYAQTINIEYEGVEIPQLFEADFSNTSNFIPSDTLRTLLIPDPSEETFMQMTPGLVTVGGAFRWKEKNQLFANLLMGFSQQSVGRPLPLLNLAYHRKLGSYFTIGVNAYGGGLDQYGIGAIARANLQFSNKLRISIFADMDNAIGVVSPVNGKGLSFQGGLTVGLR